MKVSLNWLRDYVDIFLPARELAQKLTMAGTEVGGIDAIGAGWENVVIGQVLGLEKHPDADHLQLVTVDVGGKWLIVVSGAPNLKVRDKVPFARVGAKLIDAHSCQLTELKPAKIRGIISEGMACSEKELGISDSHLGVMVLPPEAPVGTPLSKYLGDTILDLKLTPNRPDCLSIIGVAREVAALTGRSIRLPEVSYVELGIPVEKLISVEVADPDLCSRYSASLVTDVKVAASPRWMQQRLLACGMRPINNIVDITNYVMLEHGQPLHAFDYDKINGKKVIVRRGGDGESLVTLDGVERFLASDMLVIADEQEPIALAGVMGGAQSEVTDETSSILLESANFNHTSIRRTSTRLRLRSEASLRFDKGLSPELPLPALKRATQLLIELCGGKAARGIIDIYPGKREGEPILVTSRQAKRILGVELSIEQIRGVLSSLGFECELAGSSELLVTVPYWRTDVRLADDLIEEVARIIGYDQIPTTMPGGRLPKQQPDPALSLKEKVRDILVGCGMQEVITYSLTGLAALNKVVSSGEGPAPLRIANPMTKEQEYLRTTLRASLLATLSANEKREENSIRLFEIGRAYLPRENDLPEEREMLTGVLSGPQLDFFDAKGILETLFSRLGLEASFEAAEDYIMAPGRTARVVISGTVVGVLGEVQPNVAASFDISSQSVYLFEVELGKLLPLVVGARRYQSLPRFPATVRDMALTVSQEIASGKIDDIIRSFSLVNRVTLFDVYTGEQVPPGKKSLAYRIVYQSPSHTLTDEEVNTTQQQILARLGQELGASLRE